MEQEWEKSFLINVITEHVKRNLKYHAQKLEQPSSVVTASTGKAASPFILIG